ncbi:Pol polyprotein, partial [Elysia marginata]
MHVSKCAIYAKFRSSNRKEPMNSHAIPDRPWDKLGADIFHFGGHDYLLIVDYFSKFPEIARLSNKATSGVITVLRPMLARHGIPDEMIVDNNPFNSFEMHKFARDWNFKITTSSPAYAQSNGQSE